MILKLRTIKPSTRDKTMKQHDKLIAKYQRNEPLNVRMQVNLEKNIEKQGGKMSYFHGDPIKVIEKIMIAPLNLKN